MAHNSLIYRTVLVSLLILPSKLLPQDAGTIFAINVEIDRQTVLSEDLYKIVEEYGLRSNYIAHRDSTVNQISLDKCGSVDEKNIDLISQELKKERNIAAYDGNIVKEGSVISLPPCLPSTRTETVPRLALPGDSFDAYYKIDNMCESCLPTSYPSIVDVIRPELASDPLSPYSEEENKFEIWRDIKTPADKSSEAFEVLKAATEQLDESTSLDTALEYALSDATLDLKEDLESQEYILSTLRAIKESNIDYRRSILKAEYHSLLSNNAIIHDYKNHNPVLIDIDSGSDTNIRNADILYPGEIVLSTITKITNTTIPLDAELISGKTSSEKLTSINDYFLNLKQEKATVIQPNVEQFSEVSAECSEGNSLPNSFSEETRNAIARTLFFRARHEGRRWKGTGTNVLILDDGLVADSNFQTTFPYMTELISMPRKLSITNQPNQYSHGGAVTGIAMGGPNLWPVLSFLNINISSENVYISPTSNGGNQKNFLVPEVFQEHIIKDWNILNLSLGERGTEFGPSSSISNILNTYNNNRLVVIAAGNDGDSLSELFYYPQRAKVEDRASYIVVGAADGKVKASFSNYSRDLVDIFAPGCDVESWNAEGEPRLFSGTSFAAPWVTYAASIIRAIDPEEFSDGRMLKARLLASSDNLVSLKDYAKDGRLLNIIKAVSLYQDVIETEQGLVYGNFISRRVQDFCSDNDGSSLVLKIGRRLADVHSVGKDKTGYYTKDQEGNLLFGTCTPKTSVPFLRDGNSQYEDLDITDVVDVVTSTARG